MKYSISQPWENVQELNKFPFIFGTQIDFAVNTSNWMIVVTILGKHNIISINKIPNLVKHVKVYLKDQNDPVLD